MDDEELIQRIAEHVEKEKAGGAAMFMSWPDRWWDAARWRCRNDHVSGRFLKSEAKGADLCLACGERVYLTFPEDVDGPLASAVQPEEGK